MNSRGIPLDADSKFTMTSEDDLLLGKLCPYAYPSNTFIQLNTVCPHVI